MPLLNAKDNQALQEVTGGVAWRVAVDRVEQQKPR
jgi:hypothetical protein